MQACSRLAPVLSIIRRAGRSESSDRTGTVWLLCRQAGSGATTGRCEEFLHRGMFMRVQFCKAALSLAIGALCASTALAQAPGPGGSGGPGGPGGPGPAPASGSTLVANPAYTTLHFEIDIDRPATEVWKRVGKFCDIGEWMRVPCTITAGKDGEVGAVRSIAREVLVGKTELSYTYAQPILMEGRPYNLYHGTMEARPVTATTSKIVYTLMWDNSMLDDAGREREKARYRSMFEDALKNMKILSEGGTLPPRAAPGGPGGPGAPRGPAGAGAGGGQR